MRTFGGEVFWPWFTLIGTLVTLGVAWMAKAVWPEKATEAGVRFTEGTEAAPRSQSNPP
jgi:hypothetical protein